MNDYRPRIRQWAQLARGIPLAGLIALSACSSGVPRQTPQASVQDAGAAGGVAKSSPAVPGELNGPGERENRKPIATMHSEEKNGLAGRSIFFSDGDAALSEESTKVLRQQAEYLKQNPQKFIVLRAYLDGLGSRTFSIAIVQKRLNIVAETLREQGVAKSRIRQVMLGQRGKKRSCETSSCQHKGQRIEFLYK
jgi:outer membrane protein OmpA-like peptidoglycan-associated protein